MTIPRRVAIWLLGQWFRSRSSEGDWALSTSGCRMMHFYSSTFTNFIARKILHGLAWCGIGIIRIKSHMLGEKLVPSGGRIFSGSVLYTEALLIAHWGMGRQFFFGMTYGQTECCHKISHICFPLLRMTKPQSSLLCHKWSWMQFSICLCLSRPMMSFYICKIGFSPSTMILQR